jgi:DNA-binding transcriptional LysR family regulator
MLDIHRLRVFLIAAETLNFSIAAKRLHMTQPSVSQHIQALEQQIGSELFVRSARRLCLTEAGAVLVPMAEKMVAMAMHAQEVMTNLKGEVHGHLHVGCSTTPGKYLLPRLLSRFIQRYPQVQASCQVHSRQEALKQLSQGKVHLALASTHEFDKDCEFHKLYEDRVVLIAPLSHPWAKSGTASLEDLMEARHILRETGSGTYQVVKHGLERLGMRMEDLQPVLTLSNAEATALAVQEGLGVGFVSKIVVSRLVPEKVATIQVNGLSDHLHQDIYIGRNMLQPSTIAQKAFWDFVTSPSNSLNEPPTNGFKEFDIEWLPS